MRLLQGHQSRPGHFGRGGAALAVWVALRRSTEKAVVAFVQRPWFVRQPLAVGVALVWLLLLIRKAWLQKRSWFRSGVAEAHEARHVVGQRVCKVFRGARHQTV